METKMTFKKILLNELKAAGRKDIAAKIKSVRCDHNSARVETTDLFKADREYVETILSKYRKGHFDGMTDSYVYDNRRTDVDRQFMYIFLNNDFSQGVKELIKKDLAEKWEITNDQTAMAKRGAWFDQIVWRDLCALEAA